MSTHQNISFSYLCIWYLKLTSFVKIQLNRLTTSEVREKEVFLLCKSYRYWRGDRNRIIMAIVNEKYVQLIESVLPTHKEIIR